MKLRTCAQTAIILIIVGAAFFAFRHFPAKSRSKADGRESIGSATPASVAGVTKKSVTPLPTMVGSSGDLPKAAQSSQSAAPALIDPSTGQRPAYLGGEDASAEITVDGKVYKLKPNQMGNFGRLTIGANALVPVAIHYPASAAKQPVIVESEDGGVIQELVNGNLDGKPAVAGVGQTDDSAQLNLTFKSGTEDGIYRITFRHGADLKEIDFWVGRKSEVTGLAGVTQ